MANSGGLLGGIDPDMLMALGTGLLSASHYGSNPGDALNQALAAAQQRKLGAQQIAMNQYGMNLMQAQAPYIMAALQGANGPQQSQQPQEGTPQAQVPQAPVVGPYSARPQMPQQAPPQATAQQNPQSQGIDPWGLIQRGTALQAIPAMAGYGKAMVAQGQAILANNPQYVTARAAAGSPLAQDQFAVQQAQASGNPLAVQAARMRLLKDSGLVTQSSMNGAVQTFGGITPDMLGMTTLNPVQGVQTQNGRETPIPGAPETQAMIEASKEGAGEAARLRAQTAPTNGSGSRPAAAPALQGTDAVRQENYIPPLLSAPSSISQRPGNTSLGQLGAFQKEQADKASELADQWNEQASNAQQLLTQAQQIDDAARDFTPGKLADTKRELMAWGQQFGFLSPQQAKSLGSAQEGDKLSIQLQAAVTKQLGSREAAQVFSVMGRSIPNLTLSQDGLGKISAYLKGIAQYQIAMNTFGQRLAAQGNVAGVNALPSNMQTHSNPVYYILASASPDVAREFISNMSAGERGKIQQGWKKAISDGLAPRPGDFGD